ncbi:MAG: DNA recombination protein RmuC [Bacteroidales bacterium]|nr:DNA recombination protein RmuC [Bacteroidales bacterium]
MNTVSIIILCAALAVIAVLLIVFLTRGARLNRELKAKDAGIQELKSELGSKEIQIHGLSKDLEYKSAEAENARRLYEERLAELKEYGEKALAQQLEAVKSQITSESEKMLKAREDEFSKHAKESFSNIAGDFNKNLRDMKDAFEANKKTQNDSASELKTNIENAVKRLTEQTANVGDKADKLASALRGQNKMQGCWGETQLHNLLLAEGLEEGRDFDREETLRDELGIVIHNE